MTTDNLPPPIETRFQFHTLRERLDDVANTFDEDHSTVPSPTFHDRPMCTPLPTDTISRNTSAVDLTKLAALNQYQQVDYSKAFHDDDFDEYMEEDDADEKEPQVSEECYTETYTADFNKKAPIECLPVEIFDQIMSYLVIDTPSNGYTPRNRDLASCLLVSRTFHSATLSTLYSHVAFPHSTIFSKFLGHIVKYPWLGEMVRRLDFSYFTSVGLGRTQKMNNEIQKLTATTLKTCLQHTPRLMELLVSESLENDLDEGVLNMVFCELPMLKGVDFCGSSSPKFVEGVTAVLNPENSHLPNSIGLRRVGFHGCPTLPSYVFSTLLPRLSHLTHLDLSHTQITDDTLWLIPKTARITHLALSRCNRLKGQNVVNFLIDHPAVKNLIVLHLLFEPLKYRLLSEDDVEDLLAAIPKSLRSLNLSGARTDSRHVPLLRRVAKQLEELSLGHADISIDDINNIIAPGYGNESWARDGITRDAPATHDEPPVRHNLRYLDLTGVSSVSPGSIFYTRNCSLLTPASYPLQVLEFGEKVLEGLSERKAAGIKLGWVVRGTHARRGWYVRAEPGTLAGGKEVADLCRADDGARSWKMGGKWWGSRKIGAAAGEIVGVYGYYAFAK